MRPPDDTTAASPLSAADEDFARAAFRRLAQDVTPGSGTIAAIAFRRRARVRRRLAVAGVCAAALVVGAGAALLGGDRNDDNTIVPADPPTTVVPSAGPSGPASPTPPTPATPRSVVATPVSGIDVDGVRVTQLPEGFVRSGVTSGGSAQGTPEVTARFVDAEGLGSGDYLGSALYSVTVARGPVSLEGVATSGGLAMSADFLVDAVAEWTQVRGNRAVALIGAVSDPSGRGSFAVYWTEGDVTVGVMGARAELDTVRAIVAGTVVGPPPAQPQDEPTAREEVTSAVSLAVGSGVPLADRLAAVEDDPAVSEALTRLDEANPRLAETLAVDVLGVRFLGPDQAAVTIHLMWDGQGGRGMTSYVEAVRQGDRWLVTSSSYLALLRGAGG